VSYRLSGICHGSLYSYCSWFFFFCVKFSICGERFFLCVGFMSYNSVCFSLWKRRCGLRKVVHRVEFMEPIFGDRGDETFIRGV